LRNAGLDAVQIVDTKKDLRAYSMIENESGGCSSAANSSSALPFAGSCCGAGSADGKSSDLHQSLADLLKKYNVNDFAASVQVYAIKKR
jgi:hypothetical protein